MNRGWSISVAHSASVNRRSTSDVRLYLAKDPAARLVDDVQQLRPQLRSYRGQDGSMTTLQLYHHGQLMKISKGKAQCRSFFLFDNVLVYCKREKGRLSVKGTLDMGEVIVRDKPDGAVQYNGEGVANAWEINNMKKSKWYTLYAESPAAKAGWLTALEEERQASRGGPVNVLRVQVTRSQDTGFGFELGESDAGRASHTVVVGLPGANLCPGLAVGDLMWELDGTLIRLN